MKKDFVSHFILDQRLRCKPEFGHGFNLIIFTSRPPGARGIVSNFKLHDEDELPQNKKADAGASNPASKSALKNKKRREKKKEDGQEAAPAYVASASQTGATNDGNVDPETVKKLRKVNDKLSQIAKLKALQKEGKQLELNQLEKIKKESELLQELQALQLK
jgi:translation initiation factor 2A